MKIAYVSVSNPGSTKANAIHVLQMCDSFRADGHEVCLYVPGRNVHALSPEQLQRYYGLRFLPCVRPLRDTCRVFRGLCFALQAIRRVRREPVEVVYTRFVPVAFVARLFRKRVILELHEPVSNLSISERVFFFCISRFHLKLPIIVISHALRKQLAKRYPGISRQLHVVPDAAPGPTLEESAVDSNGTAGLGPGFHVGYTGSLYPGKGFELVLKLAFRCKWARFHVLGGNETDLKRILENQRIPDNLTLHGFIEPARVRNWLRQFNVCLLPNQKHVFLPNGRRDIGAYTSPLKVFEYMAAARPIISSDLPVLREILDETTAVLCPPDAIEAWTSALTRLSRDPELRNSLGASAERLFVERYTWDKRVSSVLSTIKGSRDKN